MSEDYRVNLDIYNGPLDLLLYLIRREEVDIHDIPIARITEQYIQYVDVLEGLDPSLAGEFLVMAATLVEIKTRMLLPAPPPEEGAEESLEIDPRAELVRQLLEYKAFKDAAEELREAGEEHGMRHPRRPHVDLGPEAEVEIEDVHIWDLVDAFTRMMDSIGQLPTHHEVIYDDTPVEMHATDILDRLKREGPLTFRRIFEGANSRSEIVGLFLALLELVRQRRVRARQDANFGEITIGMRSSDEPVEAEQAEPALPAEGAPEADAEADDHFDDEDEDDFDDEDDDEFDEDEEEDPDDESDGEEEDQDDDQP
jgi:segregation and condensation protein A